MKACIHTHYGSPDVLNISEVEKPVPGDDEILIKVHAATVNRTDCARLRAQPFVMRFMTGLLKPKNPVPGTDFAGLVLQTGKRVSSFKVGDRLFGFDDSGLSSHAQYLKVSSRAPLARIPDGIDYDMAAASLEGAHYAINMYNKFKFKEGQKVLINGASGAIGNAALQLGIYYGLQVAAVCNSKNMELIRSLGAHSVFDYEKEEFTRTEERYDFILDAVGKSTFAKCRPILKPGGIYISSELGPYSQNLFFALFTPLGRGKKVIFPIPSGIHTSVRLVRDLLASRHFQPVIDRVYAYPHITEAFHYVESGQKTGNVIVNWVVETDDLGLV